jgi:hypothetical protein
MGPVAAGPEGKSQEGNSMRPRILLTIFLTALFVIVSGCGGVSNCPTCGTTSNGAYTVIDIIPVPEHNPTGEPGGPFNSFDISFLDPINHLDYVSDRIGLSVDVIDTVNNLSVNVIAGANGVAGAGDNASPCLPNIPPIVTVLGNWTRFGCRNGAFHIPGFGANGLFGGFPGAQCCGARANGVNPLSGPDGEQLTPDGKTLYTGNASSAVVVFDLTTMNLQTNPPTPPTVIAVIPTGLSPDFDGEPGNSNPLPWNPSGNQAGIAPCVSSANGRAFSDPTCGDLRADELSYDPTDQILAVINGDPGLPFITFIDVSGVNARTSNCLPVQPTNPYGPPLANALGPINPPSCILGQIYYDGAPQNNSNVQVDDVGLNAAAGFICPDPSNPQVNSGVSGAPPYIVGTASIPCHHGPVITSTGVFCDQVNPAAGCNGAVALAGLGGHTWNPATGHFLLTNGNATGNLTIGTVDEIDPKVGDTSCGGVSCGPVVVNTIVTPNCMPTSIVQGPGNNFLVGCADHDGQAFPPNEYVINASPGNTISCSAPFSNCVEIFNVGGVDEVWYNTGDNRYYLAARDMPNGPVMGVIDAGTNQWLVNVVTNSNSHSISVDPSNNHAFVPMQAGTICLTQSANGCVAVMAEQ